MDLGEQLAVLQDIIYTNASQELQNAQVPPTLGRLVIEGVYSRFQQDAYTSALLQQLTPVDTTADTQAGHLTTDDIKKAAKKGVGEAEPKGTKCTGSAEDLLKQIAGKGRKENE